MNSNIIMKHLILSAILVFIAGCETNEKAIEPASSNEVQALLNQARAQSDPIEAIEIAQKAVLLALQQDVQNIIPNAQNTLGYYLRKAKRYNEAVAQFYNTLALDYIGKVELADANYNLGVAYRDLQEFNTANNFFEEAYKLFKEAGSEEWQAIVLYNHGKSLLQSNALDLAQEHAQQALSIFESLEKEQYIQLSINLLMKVYIDQNKLKAAKALYDEAKGRFPEVSSRANVLYKMKAAEFAHKEGQGQHAEGHRHAFLVQPELHPPGDRSGR